MAEEITNETVSTEDTTENTAPTPGSNLTVPVTEAGETAESEQSTEGEGSEVQAGETQEGNPKDETSDTETKTEGDVEDKTEGEFDYSPYQDEFLETGDISEKSKEELYKTFPKNLVDMYIENMKVATSHAIEQSERKAFDAVGGEKSYTDMVTWASQNMSKEETEAYDNAVLSGNEQLALMAIKGMKAQYDMANVNNKPNIQMGDMGSGKDTKDVFITREGYAKAVASEEYENNAEYRAEVDNKLSRTLKFGGFKK